MAVARYMSRKRVTTSELSATVQFFGGAPAGPTVVTIPAGSYYLHSATSTESICSALDTALEAAFAGHNFTVALDVATGLVTITCTDLGGDTWSWTWGSNAFRDLMGFSAGWAGSATAGHTSTKPAQLLLYTDSGQTNLSTGPGAYETDIKEAVSISGVSSQIGSGAQRLGPWKWIHEYEPYIYSASSPFASGTFDVGALVTQWSWEDFFAHHQVTNLGEPFIYYAAAGDAVGNEWLEIHGLVLTGDALRGFAPGRTISDVDTYWNVEIQCRPYKVST